MATGSPISGTQMDSQEIALRMIQAAEAASVAAQSAAEAPGRRSEGDKNWFPFWFLWSDSVHLP